MTLASISTRLLHALRRMGLVGALGLGMLGVSAWAQWVWLPRQLNAVELQASQARGLRHSLLADSAGAAGPSDLAPPDITRPDQAWQAVWVALPRSDRRTAMQSAVLQAARAQGLQLARVQYQGQREAWSAQGGEALWRQRMTMPVQGRPAAIQAWLQALLREPALSVDALHMQRDSAGSDVVTAQLSVSLWWRQPQEGRP
jgi:Type II secretion system (T2SS), protein M subtype b